MAQDYYEILGVSKNASDEEIKRAYRRLAQIHHPDKPGGDEKKFKEINSAYQILSDRQKRSQYDQFGSSFEQAQSQGGGGFGDAQGFSGFSGFADAFRNMYGNGGINVEFEESGGLGDIFGDIFGSGRSRSRGRHNRRGEDIAVDVEMTLEEAFNGVERQFKIYKRVVCSNCQGSGAEKGSKIITCPTCKGKGEINQTRRTPFGAFSQISPCPDCDGSGKKTEKKCHICGGDGRTKEEVSINVKIPAGVEDGMSLTMEGAGESGSKGSASGDLFINIHILPHKYFTRQNSDLIYEASIGFSQAALGAKIEVPTINGQASLNVPSGIESGKIIRMRGEGMPRLNNRGRGDQFVKIIIKMPKSLTRRQKELLEDLGKEGM